MGFSNIGAFIMLFFGFILIISTFIIIQEKMVENTSLTYSVQQERINNELKTNININNILFNNLTTPDTITVYIENTGQNKLSTEYLEVFIDNIKIPRHTNNRTFSFETGSDIINPLHWDPDETLKVEIHLNLINITHVLTATTDFGVKDSKIFLG